MTKSLSVPRSLTPFAFLAASIRRLAERLSQEECASLFKDPKAATNKLGEITFTEQGVPRYTTTPSGKHILASRSSPGYGVYNPFTRSIKLNSSVQWANPANSKATLDGKPWTIDLLAGQAHALGVPSMTAQQLMELTILHELSHYTGAIGNPDRSAHVERQLWEKCIN